jgi:hypothetical protein
MTHGGDLTSLAVAIPRSHNANPNARNDQVVDTETRPTTDTKDGVVDTETRPTDTNDQVVDTEPRTTNTNAEVEQTERRPDLLWDEEARGFCLRVYGDGAKSFIFVYRIGDRQRFTRIGKTNCERSLTRAATQRAKIADVRSRRSRISSNTSPRTLCRSHNCRCLRRGALSADHNGQAEHRQAARCCGKVDSTRSGHDADIIYVASSVSRRPFSFTRFF